MENIQYYRDSKDALMAIVIPKDYHGEGIDFLTDDSSLFQVAYMEHKKNHRITPHLHNRISRTVEFTSEALIIRKGIIRVDLYDNTVPLHQFLLREGDIIVLFSGGHGFFGVDDYEMIEIKQGPFLGPGDKTRF